ncbi:glycoside hydrolase domain-containing protein [Heyndrickxia camelliae]|uniref:LysM domain-containing protein n=1 Tax=Heyndrickxia camelliae TaxID=1707093 RepID=A0A2N3LE60_9BACI|nr:glycoside hydrolase domain-containing protein [Heyndrickxia camelliae]PKR82824.1 hypothetical protein CWO92_22350 [Heyndrickxia camelliae]
MAKGIDCATKLTASSAKSLAKEGVTHVGRYLNQGWKGLTKEEVSAVKAAGLQIFSIFESNPTKRSYFTATQGKSDAEEAEKIAKALGQPKGSVIYFTVDYDALQGDFDEILTYFKAVNATLEDYKVGAYGSYYVMEYLQDKKAVDYFFQTYGWSDGKKADFTHVYQYKIDTTLAGVAVDLDEIRKSDIGAWGKTSESNDKPSTSKPTAPKTEKYKVKSGDTFWDLEVANKWEHGTLQKLNPKVNPNKLQIGQSIVVPVGANTQTKTKPVYHIVVKGDTVSELALKYGSTQTDIKRWNKLNNEYLIKIGQKLRVK